MVDKEEISKARGVIEFQQERIKELEAELGRYKRSGDYMEGRVHAAERKNEELLESIRCDREVPEIYEPQWIINSMGELGVRVGSRCFFLYKARNIEYDQGGDDDPIYYRPVGKREFGETCKPSGWKFTGIIPSPDGGLWTLLPPLPRPESADGWYQDPKEVWHYVKEKHLLCGDTLRWVDNGNPPIRRLSADNGGHACVGCLTKGMNEIGWDMEGK